MLLVLPIFLCICCVQESLKTLLKYLVDSFWEQLVKFDSLSSIRSLKVRYEQVLLTVISFAYLDSAIIGCMTL